MLKKFIYYNRRISTIFLDFLNESVGHIDNCEDFFYRQFKAEELADYRVLEIGGTQRPLFSKDKMRHYAGLDIDNKFDWKEIYHKYYNQSCTSKVDEKFDFIFSKYLLEHVDDNTKTFDNVIDSLTINGKSIHLFPLGFHPYSLLTRIVSNSAQKKLIKILRPDAITITGYPAYFNLCNSIALKRYFRKRKDVKYTINYFFGADDYFAFFFPFFLIIVFLNRLFKLFRLNIFASNAVLIITR